MLSGPQRLGISAALGLVVHLGSLQPGFADEHRFPEFRD
jgi:hypothetical protein